MTDKSGSGVSSGVYESGATKILGDLSPIIAEQIARPPGSATIVHECDIPGMVPYRSTKMLRRALHVGQLKLFLSEVQFLTDFAPSKPAFVIYAGSGPGHTRQMLANMFPHLKFVLIDPQEHNIMGSSPADTLYFRTSRTTEFPRRDIQVATTSGITTQPKGAQIRADDKLAPDGIARIIMSEPKYTFFIIEDLFTDELAQAFRALGASGQTVLFISDIRTNANNILGSGADSPLDDVAQALGVQRPRPPEDEARAIVGSSFSGDDGEDSEHPSDLDILANNAWQHTWIHILQPLACMLKFRTPFMNNYDLRMVAEHATRDNIYSATFAAYKARFNIDLLSAYKAGRYPFLMSECLNLQAFAGATSTEVRLVAIREKTSGFTNVADYETKRHEDRLFYYNMMREYCFSDTNKRFFDIVPGFDGCADCCLALAILTRYAEQAKSGESPISILKQLLNMIHRTIKAEYHGFAFAPFKSVEHVANTLTSRFTAQRVHDFIAADGRGRGRARNRRGRGRGRGKK